MILHEIPPVIPAFPKILILGSFPSVKSREAAFFYGHPKNRFWNVICAVLGVQKPTTIEEKRAMLLENGVALWDVVASCDIVGSADSTIKNAVGNDLSPILEKNPDLLIYTNGKTAFSLYQKLIYPKAGKPAILLPSTSPANASFSKERLIFEWTKLIKK